MTKSQKIERALEKIRKDTFSVEYSMDGGMCYVVDVYVDDNKARFLVPAGGSVEDIVNRIMVEVNNHTISDQF